MDKKITLEFEVSVNKFIEEADADVIIDALWEDHDTEMTKKVMDNVDTDDVLGEIADDTVISYCVNDLGADAVLSEMDETDILDYVAEHITLDDLLDVFDKDAVMEYVDNKGWAEEKEEEEEETPAPVPEMIPLIRPVVSMHDGKVFVAGRATPLEQLSLIDAGTYSAFNGMLFVSALGVEFVATSIDSAQKILSAAAFAQANTPKEV